MPGWALPAAALLGSLFASRGNGGSEFSPEQKRLYGTQADIADMMKDLYASRIANEERYMGDAMGRVFGYVDETMGRRPDLLYAPGIFEHMPRDVPPPSAPEWVPFGAAEKVQTVTPSPPPGPSPVGTLGHPLADARPVVDVVPPVDLGAVTQLMSGTMGKVWDKATDVVVGLKDRILGSVTPDWESWSDEEIWKNLWEGEDKPGTNWKEWLGLEGMSTVDALRGLEKLMRDTLQLDELGEPFRQPFEGMYDPAQWASIPERVVSTSELAPKGEYSGPFEEYIDPATLQNLGPAVPTGDALGGTMPDIPNVNVADPQLWANYGGTTDFTRLPPTPVPEPAWRRRNREAGVRQEVELGQYWPEEDKGPVPIRLVSAADVQRLIDSGLTLELVNYDGSSLTNSEWEAFQAGGGDAVYAKGVHSGEAVEPGWWGDADYSGIYYLTSDEIDALLSGDTDQFDLGGEGRTPQEDLSLPLADKPRPQVSSLPPWFVKFNNPPTSVPSGPSPVGTLGHPSPVGTLGHPSAAPGENGSVSPGTVFTTDLDFDIIPTPTSSVPSAVVPDVDPTSLVPSVYVPDVDPTVQMDALMAGYDPAVATREDHLELVNAWRAVNPRREGETPDAHIKRAQDAIRAYIASKSQVASAEGKSPARPVRTRRL